MVSRVAPAAASSRAKSPVGMDRFVSKNESAPVIVCCASAVEGKIAAEATKVRLQGDRITAIGKTLTTYDALDTGLFVCDPVVFDALRKARHAGDTTLSGGIRLLAARRLMRAVDVGGATWCDIDTVADLESAEDLLGSRPEPEVA